MDIAIKEYFDTYARNGFLPPEFITDERCQDLFPFEDEELLELWRNNFYGLCYTSTQGHTLSGAVDNVLMKDKKLVVLDYKTRGFPLKETTADYYKEQLSIYTYILQKKGYQTEDYALLLFYIPNKVEHGGRVLFDMNLVEVPVDLSLAEGTFEHAISLLDGECPTESCQWCERIAQEVPP